VWIRKGDWALVTGSSSGIGKAFAGELAAQGVNLFLVAIEGDQLIELARGWEAAYHIQTVSLALDLSDPDFRSPISGALEAKGVQIDLVVNAAGFGYFGDFCSMTHEQIDRMVRVDVIALAGLCRLLLPGMIARKRGAIINVASIAGCLPYPYAAVYSAGKSFVRVFTQALWAENRERGVHILAVCPGYTQTNFEKISTEPSTVHLFPGEDPVRMAQKTLSRIGRGGPTFFTHPTHPFKVIGARLLPLRTFASILRRLMGVGQGSARR